VEAPWTHIDIWKWNRRRKRARREEKSLWFAPSIPGMMIAQKTGEDHDFHRCLLSDDIARQATVVLHSQLRALFSIGRSVQKLHRH